MRTSRSSTGNNVPLHLLAAVVPWAAAAIPTLTLSRAAVGFGEAIAPSAATDMVARSALPTERARSITFIFSGLHVGSIVGLLATPWLVQHAGWRSSFVLFGSLGIVWWAWFEKVRCKHALLGYSIHASVRGHGIP